MTPEQYARVKEIFAQAIAVEEGERDAFLQQACGSDQVVFREVESLLRHHLHETILERQVPTDPALEMPASSNINPYLVLSEVWEEHRHILRRRLVMFATVLGLLSAISMLRLATAHGAEWGYGVRLIAILVSFGVAWILHKRQGISLRGLRVAELVLIASVGLLEVVVYVRCILEDVDEGAFAAAVSLNNWHYIVWTFIIFIYGVFVPNTWQRTAAVLVPLAIIPFLVDVGIGYFRSAAVSFIEPEQISWTDPTPSPYLAAAIAIFAARTLHVASVTAFKARRLGQYHLVRLIGEGGMGRVYEAEHLLLKRACAVKVIHPERSADDKALQRFQREVRAMALLTHPHTIEVYDYGKTKEGVFFFAMELLPGISLGDLVESDGPLPASRAVHFLVDVCDALDESHQAGMIHRDVKPGNIFASQRGGIHDFTKLLDFGLVRQVEVDVNQTLTSKFVAGTPSFMAPEQAIMPDQLDVRCDLYAVGAVGYYLLCGRPVFSALTPMEALLALMEQEAEPLSRHRQDVPDDLERVLMRCLAKDRDHRYQTARQLREALMACDCYGQWTREDAQRWWQSRADAMKGSKGGIADAQRDTLVMGDTQS